MTDSSYRYNALSSTHQRLLLTHSANCNPAAAAAPAGIVIIALFTSHF